MTFLVPVKGKAGLDWGMDCCVSRVAPSSTAFSMSSDVRFFRRGAK